MLNGTQSNGKNYNPVNVLLQYLENVIKIANEMR